MKLHEGTLFSISKRVNNGRWMHYTDIRSGGRERAQEIIDHATALHLERCPKDRVEFSITKVY